MQLIAHRENTYVLRFDKGEDVITGLAAWCQEHTIFAASFQAIGAGERVVLSFYNLADKAYQDATFTRNLEIVSLLGNVGRLEDSAIIHTHGSFSDESYEVVGGHVRELIVSATCEVWLTAIEDTMQRGFDDVTGLNLLREV